MAKIKKTAKKPSKKIGGPFLASALFCEDISEDKDGKMSALRIIDGCKILLRHDTPDGIPSKKTPIPWEVAALIVLRTGDAPGKHKMKVVFEDPLGKREIKFQPVVLPSNANGGANVRLKAGIAITAEGLYFVDIYLDNKLMTRMPFYVTIEKVSKAIGERFSPQTIQRS